MSNHLRAYLRCLDELSVCTSQIDKERLSFQLGFHERNLQMSGTIVANGVESRKPHWSDEVLWWSCDFETFQKIKKLHKWYFQNLHLEAKHCRWSRKLPHNRVIREYFRDEEGRKYGVKSVAPMPEPKYYSGKLDVCEAYQLARTPYKTEGEARRHALSLPSAETIDKWYQQAKGFFGE